MLPIWVAFHLEGLKTFCEVEKVKFSSVLFDIVITSFMRPVGRCYICCAGVMVGCLWLRAFATFLTNIVFWIQTSYQDRFRNRISIKSAHCCERHFVIMIGLLLCASILTDSKILSFVKIVDMDGLDSTDSIYPIVSPFLCFGLIVIVVRHLEHETKCSLFPV